MTFDGPFRHPGRCRSSWVPSTGPTTRPSSLFATRVSASESGAARGDRRSVPGAVPRAPAGATSPASTTSARCATGRAARAGARFSAVVSFGHRPAVRAPGGGAGRLPRRSERRRDVRDRVRARPRPSSCRCSRNWCPSPGLGDRAMPGSRAAGTRDPTSPFEPQRRDATARMPGLRGLILYPMNALVDDQLVRLRRAIGTRGVPDAGCSRTVRATGSGSAGTRARRP